MEQEKDPAMHRKEIIKLNMDLQRTFFQMMLDDYNHYYAYIDRLGEICNKISLHKETILEIEKNQENGKQEPIQLDSSSETEQKHI